MSLDQQLHLGTFHSDESAHPFVAGRHWVSACEFHSMTDAEVLRKVLQEIPGREGSVVLLDLDSTLYEVAPRTYQILADWVSSSTSLEFPNVRAAFMNLTEERIGY